MESRTQEAEFYTPFLSLKLEGDENMIISGHYNGLIIVWDLNLKEKEALHGHTGPIFALSKKVNLLASGGSDTVRIWNLNSFNIIAVINYDEKVNAICLLGESKVIVSSDNIEIFKINDSSRESWITKQFYNKSLVKVSFDERYIVVSDQLKIWIWDLLEGKLYTSIEIKTLCFALSQDNQWLAVGFSDLQLWNLASMQHKVIVNRGINCVAISSDMK